MAMPLFAMTATTTGTGSGGAGRGSRSASSRSIGQGNTSSSSSSSSSGGLGSSSSSVRLDPWCLEALAQLYIFSKQVREGITMIYAMQYIMLELYMFLCVVHVNYLICSYPLSFYLPFMYDNVTYCI